MGGGGGGDRETDEAREEGLLFLDLVSLGQRHWFWSYF